MNNPNVDVVEYASQGYAAYRAECRVGGCGWKSQPTDMADAERQAHEHAQGHAANKGTS